MEEKVSKEISISEVNAWLDYKKVSDKKREAQKEQIEVIQDAISDGTLTLNEDRSFTHHLKFPIGKDVTIISLEYKPRVAMQTIHSHLQGVKPTDGDGRLCAYVAALTSKPKDVIKSLDTEDYNISQAIALFFL